MSERAKRRGGVVASGFFVLRTPLLPFDDFETWGRGLEAAGDVDDPPGLEAALARDRDLLRERLRALLDRPELRDALFVASPKLSAAIDAWRGDPDSERGRSTEEALVAYLSRAAARPTPFGLFAGSTVGTIDAKTSLTLGPVAAYERHSRLDTGYLSAVAQTLVSDAAVRRAFVYRPNSSLYEIGGRYHFAEAMQTTGGRSYTLAAVEKTPYLAATLERASGGAPFLELAAALVDDEVTQPEAEEYIGELVASQVLIADVGPQLTGPQPTDSLIETLVRHDETATVAHMLDAARAELARIDEGGVGAPEEHYRAVGSILEAVPAPQPELSRLVQVDLFKPGTDVTLGRGVVRDALHAVRALHAFAPAAGTDPLVRFRQEFVRRYETRSVPLVEALDEEHGIGFDRADDISGEAAPLLAGLPLARPGEDGVRWTRRDAVLLRKLAKALETGLDEIALEDSELDALGTAQPTPLPDAFEVVASLEAASAEAADAGEFRLLVHSASGPPGVRLLGRFCHDDASLHELVRSHLHAEETNRPDAVFAEIVHLPEGRVGNILARPVLRSHEIPYLAASGAPPDRQIPISDLLVSVVGDRIVLRSARIGREVVPRLTTAHNYSRRSLRLYRFLCALANQDVISGLMWTWGPLEHAPFLPRVVAGRAVLSRARWNVDGEELAAFRERDARKRFEGVQELRRARRLPRFVALVDGDNELLVDLDNLLSVEALAKQIRTRPAAALVELLPAVDRLPAEGPEGRYTSHLVIPFVREIPVRTSAATAFSSERARRFVPGSEWLYAKLFTGRATSDAVLDHVGRAVEATIAAGAADRWFFIRYGDPDWHLRLRVHGSSDDLLDRVLPTLRTVTSPLLDAGLLWRVQLDTYEREVERYGGDEGIVLSEQVFHADSDAVLQIVRAVGAANLDLRWRAALLGIDLLFDDFDLALEEKREIARGACRGYGREFGAGKPFQRAISRRYRDERESVERLLDTGHAPPSELAPVADALARRSERIRPVAAELRKVAAGGRLTQTVPELLMSYAHMHVNRLLRSSHRAQELVLYELLSRAYSAQAGRR